MFLGKVLKIGSVAEFLLNLLMLKSI
jgi:hypothetical protein